MSSTKKRNQIYIEEKMGIRKKHDEKKKYEEKVNVSKLALEHNTSSLY